MENLSIADCPSFTYLCVLMRKSVKEQKLQFIFRSGVRHIGKMVNSKPSTLTQNLPNLKKTKGGGDRIVGFGLGRKC